jgi:hypothetical protein
MPSDALPVSEQIRAWIALHPVMALLNVERIYWCWSVDKSGLCSLTDIQTADTGQAEVYREGGRYHVRHYYVAKSATAMQPAEYAQDDVWQGVDADDCLAAVQGLGARGL